MMGATIRWHRLKAILGTREKERAMKRWIMVFLMAGLFTVTQAAAQQTPPQPGVTPPAGEIPQIVAYDNEGLLGDHIHIFGNTTDLGKWNNSISSMVIVS